MTIRINAAWHTGHAMPPNATVDERIAWHVEHQRKCSCRPIPAKLRERMRAKPAITTRSPEAKTARAPRDLRSMLSGGDRRSVAQSERARALIERAPERVSELAHLATGDDWLVSMRAMDLLEKLVHEHADWVQPHKNLFIGPLADSGKWEIRLQIVRALPFLRWTARERSRVVEILLRDVEHPQKFVRAWALDSLATFATNDDDLMPVVSRALGEFERSGSKALVTRARRIRKRLSERPS